MLSMFTAALVALATPDASPAPVAELNVGDTLSKFGNLKPGTRTYLRYRVLKGVWRPVDIWRREIRFEDLEGRRRLHIVHSWTGPTSAPTSMDLDSWFELGTFAPLSHERRFARAEETRNEGFLFTKDRVEELRTTPSNTRAGFVQKAPKPVFNFETDMEMLQTLPLAEGYAVRIPFYHPGGPPPADWQFKVTGSVRLQHAGSEVDCWTVSLSAVDDTSPRSSRFYVAKRGQLVLRVEQPQADGSLTVKILTDISDSA